MRNTVRVAEFVERALYDPGTGFYETGGAAGRRGDFVTSPEVGPLFGAVLARALDGWWADLGRPDPFVVHEHGAGPGTLARTFLVASPACAPALRWVLVERSAAQRARHPDHLPHVGAPGTGSWGTAGGGPLVASAPSAPAEAPHVVVANELLDNLPFDLVERTDEGWAEVRLTAAGEEVLAPLPPERASARPAAALPATATVGARAPLQGSARAWVEARLAALAPGGRLVVLDYGVPTTAELTARPWTEWVRTYRGHERGTGPWEAPGSQDVTVEVAFDQLPPPHRLARQADVLQEWGLRELVEEGRAAWHARTGPADLAALRARSRVTEADVLLDRAGLGAFWLAEWQADGAVGRGR